MDISIVNKISKDKYQSLLDMIHSSFEEYHDIGIDFSCSHYSMDDLREKVLSKWYFIALDDCENIAGVTAFFPINRKDCYESITAISPKYKGFGIGSKLMQARKTFLRERHYKRVISDTAAQAKPSVDWHLKKCGCCIMGYKSYENTGYYSYLFCEHIEGKINLFFRFAYFNRFIISFLLTRLLVKKNGQRTFFGLLIHKGK